MRFFVCRRILSALSNKTRQMALFTQELNPMTGQNQWVQRGDEYDYHQEVANAGFGDMLHDWERNQKYYAALRKTIAEMHKNGRKAHVLDIGTGTGILSMMALAAGADSVTACEAFLPMANCAEKILVANGVSEKVNLIKKRSTDIEIGKDMPHKANLLVTEVLDTELIGEGAIGIYNHAHEKLLTEDVICIPARAKCYAQLVQSPLAAQWNNLKILANLDGDILLRPSKDVQNCKGEAALHDVQLSQLPPTHFHALTDAVQIFEFDFNTKMPRETQRSHAIRLKCQRPGTAELVFYWWDIEMDSAGEIRLSCAPFWAHPDLKECAAKRYPAVPLPNVIPWRDHWMQAIYYIPKPVGLHQEGSEVILHANHDEYSLWFDAYIPEKQSTESKEAKVPRHSCTCGLHATYARSRIGQMNQSVRNKRYLNVLEDTISKDSHVLVLGDGCILGLAAAKLGAASVICHEPQRFSRQFIENLAKHNEVQAKIITALSELADEELKTITHIFAEPFFLQSILPWDNFYFGTLLQQIREKLSTNVQIIPHSARIYALPVEFLDLHKIRTPIGNCEGFDLQLFDEMVKSSMELAQSKVEAQPLWEYPCRALGAPQEILAVEFQQYAGEKATSGSIKVEADGICNGIALWVDWHINDTHSIKTIVSSGPTEPVEPGNYVKWDMFVRQGVHFICAPEKLTNANGRHVQWSVDFKPILGQINFNFQLVTT